MSWAAVGGRRHGGIKADAWLTSLPIRSRDWKTAWPRKAWNAWFSPCRRQRRGCRRHRGGRERPRSAAWIIVDGYHFNAAYQQALRAAGLRLLVLDHFGHCTHYSANIVLNPNSNASESYYASRERTTRLLLGLPFVLLRREFTRWIDESRTTAAVANRLLVSMGGATLGT